MTLIITPPFQVLPLPEMYLNPADKKATCVLSGNNLTATTSDSAYAAVRATRGISSGVMRWEVAVSNVVQGGHFVYHSTICQLAGDINLIPGYNMPNSFAAQDNTQGTAAQGLYSCTLDMDARTFRVLRNGAPYAAPIANIPFGTWYPAVAPVYSDIMTVNFGDTPFVYHPN